ncbi:MAG: hypothetical protein ACR2P0_09055 [Acidimicrobiales bacterium]
MEDHEQLGSQQPLADGDWDGETETAPLESVPTSSAPSVTPEPRLRGKAARRAEEKRIVDAAMHTLTNYGISILHNRLVPGSDGVLENVAIGNHGVTVVRAAPFKGRIRTTRKDIYVGGTNCAVLVNGLMSRVDTVRHMVGGECEVQGAFVLTRQKFSEPKFFGPIAFANTQAIVEWLAQRHRTSEESLDIVGLANELDGIFLPFDMMS